MWERCGVSALTTCRSMVDSTFAGPWPSTRGIYNSHRPHQSRNHRPPLHEPGQAVDVTARIKRTQVVQGLISEYRRAA
jgi:hypothetical protein